MDIILEPGDIFYLPRGWWHEVSATGGETFHLAIGTYPPYVTDYLNWIVEDISAQSNMFRMPVDVMPLTSETSEMIIEQFSKAVASPENQIRFSQLFLSHQRMDSPYAIEFFGNENASPLPGNSQLFINASNCVFWSGAEMIAGGVKLSLNGLSKEIFKIIRNRQGISVGEIFANFPDIHPSDLQAFLNEMIVQDIIAIHLPR